MAQLITLEKYASTRSIDNLLDIINEHIRRFNSINYKPISISHTIYINNDRQLVYSAIVMYELVEPK